MADFLKTVELANGIKIDFYDQSNRYFGDFHRVVVQVTAKIPCDRNSLSDKLSHQLPGDRDEIDYETTLEQMAVPSGRLEDVRNALIQNFLETTGRYLTKAGFAEGLLKKKLRNRNVASGFIR